MSTDVSTHSADAADLHESLFVFDACVPTMGFFADEKGEVDALRSGGVDAINITVAQQKHTFTRTIESIERHRRLARTRSDALRICTTVDELLACKQDGVTGLVMHFQDSRPIDDELGHLETFFDLGVRVFQLTYNLQGLVGTGCCERFDGGLTEFGLQVVAECNRLGLLIDLSHCNYQTCWDTIAASRAPVALTHVGAHALCPAAGRNKSDDLLKAVAETGGVIGLAFFPALVKRNPETHEVLQAEVDDVLNHIEHVVELAGIDHVGIGSDLSNFHARTLEMPADSSLRWNRATRPDVFGVGPVDRYDPYPHGLESHATISRLTGGLLARGFAPGDIAKIMGENWLRLYRAVWP